MLQKYQRKKETDADLRMQCKILLFISARQNDYRANIGTIYAAGNMPIL